MCGGGAAVDVGGTCSRQPRALLAFALIVPITASLQLLSNPLTVVMDGTPRAYPFPWGPSSCASARVRSPSCCDPAWWDVTRHRRNGDSARRYRGPGSLRSAIREAISCDVRHGAGTGLMFLAGWTVVDGVLQSGNLFIETQSGEIPLGGTVTSRRISRLQSERVNRWLGVPTGDGDGPRRRVRRKGASAQDES